MSPEKEEKLINLAIRINFVANVILLGSKIGIMALTSSMSVLAGLVDGVLDFLSTVIIWVTMTLIQTQDRNRYPISRRRLEPLSVLVFSVIMVTSFFQVALSSVNRLMGDDHTVVKLSMPSIVLMAATVVIKLLCWIWCRLIPSSSVQVLAQDAMTDVIFNTFSIIFPLSTAIPFLSWVCLCLCETVLMHNYSWLIRTPLVPGFSRRCFSVHLYHVELGRDGRRVYSPFNRCSRLRHRPQYPTVHDDAFFAGHSKGSGPQGLLRRRQAQC